MNIQRNKRTKLAVTSFAAARTLSYSESSGMVVVQESRTPRINFINESSMIHETARTKESASSRSTERSNILLEGERIPSTLDSYLRSERHSAPSVHEITNHDDMSSSEH